ncbi:cell division protein DivIVA [Streptomyces sp. NPDC057499]|uniref:cell division protein DivIVA n=1 Tax=Streptomyces sp. NPDC057499 TaxID=3346150 RepID=UPI00368D3422
MRVFWFLLVTMVVVVAAVTLAVVGGGRTAILQDVAPERLTDPLPATRPVGRADLDALRIPVALRGYRMMDVDETLDRLGAELAERDARIAELESALAGVQATAVGGPGLVEEARERAPEGWQPPEDRPKAPWEAPAEPARHTDEHGTDEYGTGEHGEEPRR